MMIRYLFSSLAMLVIATSIHAQQPGFSRSKYNFNPGWLVKVGDDSGAEAPAFADTAWKKVTLPYAWNEASDFKIRIQQFPTGVAWYRKHFKLPADAAGKKIFLEFEGIRQGGEFYLNGESIGRSENGVMAFGFDITDKLNPAPQENVLAARIDNAWTYRSKAANSPFQWNDKNDVPTTLKVNGRPIDTVITRTGFRKTEFAQGYVRLNDRAIQMK